MKHTRGPWKYIGWDGQMEIRTEDNKETGIAFLGDREDGAIPNGQTRANAHLIAASPDLLNLAKMFEHHVMGVKVGKDGKAFTSLELECFIRDMIKKAEGS